MLTKEYSQIPQNEKSFYILKLNKKMRWVEIMFNHNEEIYLENLFLILKSYGQPENLIKRFYIIGEESNDGKVKIFHTISTKKIKTISYVDFCEWFENLYSEDQLYLNKFKFYGFQVEFYDFSEKLRNEEIYPKYPWNISFSSIYISKSKKEKVLEKEKEKILKELKILKIELRKKKYRLYNARRFNQTRIKNRWEK